MLDGQASDAAIANGIGMRWCSCKIAIAKSKNPIEMAKAMKLAVIAEEITYREE